MVDIEKSGDLIMQEKEMRRVRMMDMKKKNYLPNTYAKEYHRMVKSSQKWHKIEIKKKNELFSSRFEYEND